MKNMKYCWKHTVAFVLSPYISVIQPCSLNLACSVFLSQFTFNLARMLPNYKEVTSLIPLFAQNLVKPLMWISYGYIIGFHFLPWGHLREKFSQCKWRSAFNCISNLTLCIIPWGFSHFLMFWLLLLEHFIVETGLIFFWTLWILGHAHCLCCFKGCWNNYLSSPAEILLVRGKPLSDMKTSEAFLSLFKIGEKAHGRSTMTC